MFVPVVNSENQPLMPTTPSRARRWIVSKRATPFWKKGVFCIRLNERTREKVQDIAIGIDPGSKKEGFSVKSAPHTYLNIQADAVTWVKDAVKTRSEMRRNRRNRKTPCRSPRYNRAKGNLVPSTQARWQWKIRIIKWLKKMFPITHVVIEDIKAKTTGKRKWDKSFSPLEIGKKWFYDQINPILKQGWETKQMRDELGLKKLGNKLSNDFHAHCVDSWVLAASIVGGHTKPDNKDVLLISPLRFHRRQLHYLQPAKYGIRPFYGSTISLGLKRGSLVKHSKHGLTYVGGTSMERISLHSVSSSRRLCQNAKPDDCKFLAFNDRRAAFFVT